MDPNQVSMPTGPSRDEKSPNDSSVLLDSDTRASNYYLNPRQFLLGSRKIKLIVLGFGSVVLLLVGGLLVYTLKKPVNESTPTQSNLSNKQAISPTTKNIQQTPTKSTAQPSGASHPAGLPIIQPPGTGSVSQNSSINTIPLVTLGSYNFYYAGARQSATASGASVNLSQKQPRVTQTTGSQNHSLIELSVGNSNGSNYVEVGWMVDQPQWGDSLPHLFVYHWANGGQTCYNVCGFVQVSKTNVPGETVTVGVTKNFEINNDGTKWNVYYGGVLVGYYPDSLWSGSFTQVGLIQIFGEVARYVNTTSCIQMGDGVLGSASGSASISNFSLIGAQTSPLLYPYATVNSGYDYGASTATGLSIGGPGKC